MKYRILIFLAAFLHVGLLYAQVPPLVNYQGRVAVNGGNFDGAGQFKFALVDGNGSATLWSNDGTSFNGSQPTSAVTLTVEQGLYSVLLGDTVLGNMTAVPVGAFANPDVRLRVWFNDGTNGFQLLSPDQRLSPSAYLADGSVTSAAIANSAINTAQIAPGAVTGTSIAQGTIGGIHIFPGTLDFSRFAVPAAPASGQVLSFDGSSLAWTTAASIWSLNGSGQPYFLGRVGIGASSPAAQLHISSADGNVLRMDGTSPRVNFTDTANSNSVASIGSQAGSFYITNNQPGAFMSLSPTGFLGLGTTTPQSRLHVSGTDDALRLTGPQPYLTLDNTTGGFISRIQANGGGMDLKTNGAVINNHPGIIHLDQSGTVGLGTTTPRHQLSIKYFNGGPIWTSNGWIGAIDLHNAGAIAWDGLPGGNRFGMASSNGTFLMWHTTADPGTAGSPAIYDFAITNAGNVGIGTTSPANKLTVQTPTNGYGFEHTDGSVRFGSFVGGTSSTGGWFGTFSNHKLNFFTNNGAARMTVDTNGNVGIGTIAPTALLDVAGNVSVSTLTIRGGADLAEPFQMKEDELERGSVVVIDEEHPGRLKRSTRAYDRRVAGIVSGANGIKPGISLQQEGVLDGGQNVALSGRVYVHADASNGAIAPGDMLTTSDTPGYAMKVSDSARAQGAVIGKAMSALDDGQGVVLVLVTLQ